MGENSLQLRKTEEADLRAAYDVFTAAEGELWRRHGLEWAAPRFEAWSAPQRHLLAEDGERSWVALDGARLAGFGAALAREDTWFLAALFVSPDCQGRHVGRQLLERCWGSGYRRRITITDSIQPVSTGMYARRGLFPTTPILTLSGTPKCDPPNGLEAVSPNPEALATLDRSAYGFDRTADHRFWREHSTEANLWLLDGEPIAYAYVDSKGLIGPLAGREADAAALALRAELARRESLSAEVQLPGIARRLVGTALAAGLRLTRPPGLLLLGEDDDPPGALAISGYWLC